MESQPPNSAKGTSNEAAVLAEIVKWSEACPLWQRDALRRLCAKDQLDEVDIDALVLICKGSDASAEPIAASHVRDPAASSAVVTLKALHSVQHVNALAFGERLTFDKTGITVFYGDNGSGKSGYARILKRACRARSLKGETVLPNIYATTNGQAMATFEFLVNGQNRSSTWLLNQSPDSLLSAISVFDSQTANVHVNQPNDIAYTPLPLKILASLAQACQEVKQRLNAEIKALEQQTPVAIAKPICQRGTRVGKLMANLSATTEPKEVKTLTSLTEAEKTRLASLKTDLAADPARAARQSQSLKTKLDKGIGCLERLIAAVADDNIAALGQAFRTFVAAQAAAQAASRSLFSQEPLPDIGSDIWQALWETAHKYSETSAYPMQSFPVTEDGARCVLCFQKLNAEATERFNLFEAFVKNESKRREAEAKATYERALETFNQAHIPHTERITIAALVENDLGNAVFAKDLRRSIAASLWRLRHVARRQQRPEQQAVPPIIELPITALRTLSSELQTRATALLADGTSEERKQLLAERDELVDREWLAGIENDIIAEINRKKAIAVLQKASRDTATNRITAKSAEIAESLVTNALRAQFAKEVNQLNVAGLEIELRQERTAQGVPHFRVSLINKPTQSVGAVLSEGEHRCVALAAFLAELTTTDSRSTIVFDDPVSSLDHMHREAVANRLAKEGQHRQIVVFTHDIAFLFLLDKACHEKGTHIASRSINRGAEFAGFCCPNPPPNAQPVDKVIDAMQRHLANMKIHYERGNREEWYSTVRYFYEQLRTTWERAIEQVLSPVIKRLANKVDTKGLLKLTVLTPDDYKIVYRKLFDLTIAIIAVLRLAGNFPHASITRCNSESTMMFGFCESLCETCIVSS